MLSPFLRALAYYGGGGYALVLLCTALFLDPFDTTRQAPATLRRRAMVLAPIGLIHPVIATVALVLARDAARDADTDPSSAASVVAGTCLAGSVAVMVGVLAAAG